VNHEIGVGRENVEVWSRLGELGERGETARQIDVVRVEDGDEPARATCAAAFFAEASPPFSLRRRVISSL
jgi:hypothetical protein